MLSTESRRTERYMERTFRPEGMALKEVDKTVDVEPAVMGQRARENNNGLHRERFDCFVSRFTDLVDFLGFVKDDSLERALYQGPIGREESGNRTLMRWFDSRLSRLKWFVRFLHLLQELYSSSVGCFQEFVGNDDNIIVLSVQYVCPDCCVHQYVSTKLVTLAAISDSPVLVQRRT